MTREGRKGREQAMQNALHYRAALHHIADIRREVHATTGRREECTRRESNSWSSVAFWQARHKLRA